MTQRRSFPAAGALLCALLASASTPARAQTPAVPTEPPKAVPDSVAMNPGPWSTELKVGLGIEQSSYSANWSGGDQGAIAWSARTDFLAERQFSRKFNWRNELDMAYGQTSRQRPDPDNPDVLKWDAAEKTSDLIFLESTGRWTLQAFADPYLSLRMDTQFRDDSNPLGRLSFNPIRLKETAGLAKVFRKSETREFITRFGVGARQTIGKTIVQADPRETDSYSSNDGGFEWFTTMKEPLAGGRIQYRGDLLVFAPIFYSGSDAVSAYDEAQAALDPTHTNVDGYWRIPDVNWRNQFTSKITKVISVDLFVQLIYDKFDTAANVDLSDPVAQHDEIQRNIRLAGQFKQTLSLGVNFSVF